MFGYGLLFDDMPSADTDKCRPVGCDSAKIKAILQQDVAKRIIRKYDAIVGYGSEDITLAIFFEGNRNENASLYRKNRESMEKKIQNLLHELDVETELYFRVAYSGNVGWDAYKDVYETSGIWDYDDMIDNSKYQFGKFYGLKGVVTAFANAHGKDNTKCVCFSWNRYKYQLKGYASSTDIRYEDIKGDMLEYAKSYIGRKYPKLDIRLTTGKRASDSGQPYEAFVVEYRNAKTAFDQKGSFVITQNKFGDGTAVVRAPLAGESERKFDFNDWRKALDEIIDWICS